MHDAFSIVVIDTGHNMADVSGVPAIDTHFRRAFFDPLILQTCRVNQKMTRAKRYCHLYMYVCYVCAFVTTGQSYSVKYLNV